MAEAALIAAPAPAPSGARPSGVEPERRAVPLSRMRCRAETPAGDAKPVAPSDAAAVDYTDFSMVGIAG